MLVQGHGKAQGLVCQVMATGSEPLGEYQRKTQSPLIWCVCRLTTTTNVLAGRGDTFADVCSSFAFSSLSSGMSFFVLWCWVSCSNPCGKHSFCTAACQAESARSEGQLSRHDCDMEQPGLCGRCQARCSREGKLHVSLLLAVAVQAASGADGYADGRVEGLRWRPGCRPGRDAI